MASPLPPLSSIQALAPQLAQAAQQVYDAWRQDEDGWDDGVGYGGICHLIADRFVDVLAGALGQHLLASSKPVNDEVHVNVTVACAEGVYELDVPWRLYERGGGYNWTKLPGVTFRPDDVTLFQLSNRPDDYWLFADELADQPVADAGDYPEEAHPWAP